MEAKLFRALFAAMKVAFPWIFDDYNCSFANKLIRSLISGALNPPLKAAVGLVFPPVSIDSIDDMSTILLTLSDFRPSLFD